MLDILQLFLASKGLAYLRLDGNTRVDERLHLVKRFNSSQSTMKRKLFRDDDDDAYLYCKYSKVKYSTLYCTSKIYFSQSNNCDIFVTHLRSIYILVKIDFPCAFLCMSHF